MKAYIACLVLLGAVSCAEHSPLWPDGRIPFVMVGITPEQAVTTVRAMALWEAASGGAVSFYPTETIGDGVLHIMPIPSSLARCSDGMSRIGYNKDRMSYVFIGREWPERIAVHELGHVLGLIHEHQRPDRDLYITVLLDGLCDLLRIQYAYFDPDTYDFRAYPYDYKSIMHYGPDEATGIIDSRGHDIGSDTISPIDALKIRDMYSR